jgi:hydroxypyruvate isomerase
MHLTICCETLFTDRPVTERFAPIRALGVDALELWGLPPGHVAAVEAALRSAQCRLALFCGNRQHSLIDADERDGFLDELRQSVASARRLNCSHLTILSDKVDAQGIPIPPPRPLSADQRFDSLLEGLKQAASLAAAENITLLLEPLNTRIDHPGYTLCHSGPAFEIVRNVGSPRLKVLYDAYHMQIMEGNLLPTLEANLDAIGHLHIADVPGRHEPGTGEIDYASIAALLRATGYQETVGLECFPQAGSEAAIRSFCRLFG